MFAYVRDVDIPYPPLTEGGEGQDEEGEREGGREEGGRPSGGYGYIKHIKTYKNL